MKADILVIGAGASGLMAAWSAARSAADADRDLQVCVLEKMPRPGRKIMITGKGRCNFTNVKPWNEFSGHIRSRQDFLKPSFHNMPPQAVVDFFESYGMKTVVERGDRAFPASYHSSEVVDTLVNACHGTGVKIECEAEVLSVERVEATAHRSGGFRVSLTDGREWLCRKLIVATGGLSYPATGSSGDGYRWAEALGHKLVPTFPSLTALVPQGYKDGSEGVTKWHIDRSNPLSALGESLCGLQLKNVGCTLLIDGMEAESLFGDVDFTDGGIEGPVGFQLSRKAVKAMVNGSSVSLSIDMKPGVELTELTARVKQLWQDVDKDPRSRGLREKEKCRILLGKLLPREMIPAFSETCPGILTLERRSRTETKVWVNLVTIAKCLKDWRFDIAGHVGYERAVITAGGVATEQLMAKTLESRLVGGLYFCGELVDIDCDTGGYNLQSAFCSGALAGRSAALSLCAGTDRQEM